MKSCLLAYVLICSLSLFNINVCHEENVSEESSNSQEDIVAARELAKESWIHSIKHRLLEQLGLQESQLPNITKKLMLPKRLEQELQEQYVTQSDDALVRQTDRMERKLDVIATQCHASSDDKKSDSVKLSFDLTQLSTFGIFDTATLVVKKLAIDKNLSLIQHDKIRLKLYHLLISSKNSTNVRYKKELVESRGVEAFYTSDLFFDITSMVAYGSKKNKKKIEFELLAETLSGAMISPSLIFQLRNCSDSEINTMCENTMQIFTMDDSSSCQPLIMIWTHSTSYRLRKRRSNSRVPILKECRYNTFGYLESKSCCLDRFQVDFRDIGWSNWIIAPSTFTTGDCLNGCNNLPGSLRKNSSCQPVYGELRLLTFTANDSLKLITLNDMAIVDCQCTEQ